MCCSVVTDSLQPHGLLLANSSVHEILQARIQGVAIPSPQNLPDPRIKVLSLTSALADGFFNTSITWEARVNQEVS